MKRVPWKYLAGLIDGEGCIDVRIDRKTYVSPRVRIGMAESAKHLLDMLHNSYGGQMHYREGGGNWQGAWTWQLSGYKACCKFLRNIVNHLILKKEQARFILWMENNIKGKHVSTEVRDAIREELKLMKRDPHRLSESAEKKISLML